jgi:hypothetical protein
LLGEQNVPNEETLKMSRGLGRVQTGLLAIIERQEKNIHTYHLARLLYQPHVEGVCHLTDAQIKATYRALCSLQKCGKIERCFKGRGANGFIWWRRLGAERSDEVSLARLDADRALAAFAFGQRIRTAMGDRDP